MKETIRAYGINWKIKRSRNNGGSFDWDTGTIELPSDDYAESKDVVKLYQTSVLLHELLEMILVQRQLRFRPIRPDQEYLFSFNHTDFTLVCEDLAQIIKDNNLKF